MTTRPSTLPRVQTASPQPVILCLQRKGGTGKTFTACGLAAYYDSKKVEYRIIDCDIGAGDIINRPGHKEGAVTLVGFDAEGVERVLSVLDQGHPTIMDFGANTYDLAGPLIEAVRESCKKSGRTPVFVVPFDGVVKSRLFVLEMMDRFQGELIIGASIPGENVESPPLDFLPPSRTIRAPRLSPRLAGLGYDAHEQSLISMASDGAGATSAPGRHSPAAIAARGVVRLFVKECDRFASVLLP